LKERFKFVKVTDGLTTDFGTLFVLKGSFPFYKDILCFSFGGSSLYVTGVKNFLYPSFPGLVSFHLVSCL